MTDKHLAATVVGLGPMGQAMARTLLDHGVDVTVLNRTPARADDLVAAGARRAESAAEALDAADLVIISLTHYEAMYDLLAPATDRLAGRTLANLSSDTPAEAERATAWAREHGADFLAGGIMTPAIGVGGEEAYCFYSGPRPVLDRHAPLLGLLARPEYVGEQPGLALLWYQAMLDVFMTTFAAVDHAAALVASAGVPAKEFVPHAAALVGSVPEFLEETARQLDERSYPDIGANTAMMAAGIDHITRTSEAAGIDPGLPAAVRELYRRAIASGHGQDGSDSIYEAIIAPPAATTSTEGAAA